ncbi:lipopolysaccharide transport periplasmic protein LptA [uncultured Tateyamaria sp.]|uniref:lipopolysaccharide transport periplasmic protein LptA n=1 Tax=uncultured Tateyamaria sp. TaxID=455651 RepID=UPI00263912C3|nr:lipopolysaccharide transport periplasmic protein LptA [uncultured Tateyamaria sp.]
MTFFRAIACLLFIGLITPLYAQGTQVAFGAIRQDTSAPVEVSADELNVDQETGAAIFTGNVVIGQGDMRLSAPRVLVVYRDDQAGIERMEATGGVTLVSGPDAAESQRADYSIDTGLIVMTGDVLLAQGQSAISSDRMTVNLEDGTARMQGSVKTILQTGNN